MKYDPIEKTLIMKREMNNLDRFVFDFIRLLEGRYVLVSGYVSIITGRARATEDVDLIIPEIDYSEFFVLWQKIMSNGFECLNTENPKEAFEMLGLNAIRFCRKGKPIPNMEFKIVKDSLGRYSLDNKIKLFIKNNLFLISSFEMQIVYKRYYLGSPKDLEDALHLEELFKSQIDFNKIKELESMIRKVKNEEY